MNTTPDVAPETLRQDITPKRMARITISAHRALRFRPLVDYFFASSITTTEILAAELASAAINYPLAFRRQGEDVELLAMLSLTPGRNQYISDKGGWLSDVVPASVCTYPFQYRAATQGGRPALFADLGSGLLNEQEGEPLFDEAGKPSTTAKEIVRLLQSYERNRRATHKVCAQLERYKLLVPWAQESDTKHLQQLLRVDEAALNRLPQGALAALRQTGALPLAYAHLLSLALLPRLSNLTRLHAAAEEQRRQLLGSCFRLDDSLEDTIRF